MQQSKGKGKGKGKGKSKAEGKAKSKSKGKGKAKGKAKGGSKEPGPFTLYGLAYCPYTGTHGRVCLRVSALSC